MRQVHAVVVPQVPAQPVRRARGGGRGGGRLGVPALPRRLQLQQLPQGAELSGPLVCCLTIRRMFLNTTVSKHVHAYLLHCARLPPEHYSSRSSSCKQ